jgi:MFS family permease
VIGSVNTILKKRYGKDLYTKKYSANVTAIAFAGFVVGMLFFGYTSDKYSRKWSLLASTIIMIIFAILATGAYGAHGSPEGLFMAIAAYRFFIGVGLGGEYPAGSVGAAEGSAELKSGTRNWWFVMFTNVQIDIGFVIGALVPMIVVSLSSPCYYCFLRHTYTFISGLYNWGNRKWPLKCRMAYLSWNWRHSTALPTLHAFHA